MWRLFFDRPYPSKNPDETNDYQTSTWQVIEVIWILTHHNCIEHLTFLLSTTPQKYVYYMSIIMALQWRSSELNWVTHI